MSDTTPDTAIGKKKLTLAVTITTDAGDVLVESSQVTPDNPATPETVSSLLDDLSETAAELYADLNRT